MMNGGGMSSGIFGFGFIGLLLMLALLVVIIWIVKGFLNPRNSEGGHQDPLATLDERLARGEISEEEYDRIKRRLNMSKKN